MNIWGLMATLLSLRISLSINLGVMSKIKTQYQDYIRYQSKNELITKNTFPNQ